MFKEGGYVSIRFLGLSKTGCVGDDGNRPAHVHGTITIVPYEISHPEFERPIIC